jgi:hypothetical protein
MKNGTEQYAEDLLDEKWIKKRKKILRRDGFKCKMCGSNNNLEVHHRYYIYSHKPWDYSDSALVTLCESCHKIIHKTMTPFVYYRGIDGLSQMDFTPCERCGGTGYLPQYKHVEDGICFRCRGLRYEELIEKNINYSDYINADSDVFDSEIICENADEIYEAGLEIYKSKPKLAIKKITQAALCGCVQAQYKLGLHYRDLDYDETALTWLLYATMQGYKKALWYVYIIIKHDKNLLEIWKPLLENDNYILCRLSFRVIAKYFGIIDVKSKPSLEKVCVAIDTLLELSDENYQPAVEYVDALHLKLVKKRLKKEARNSKDSI